MKYPNLIQADRLRGDWPKAGHPDGTWSLARPEGFSCWRSRIALAWGVFVGRYDALQWRQQ